jgi:hypothetical protein
VDTLVWQQTAHEQHAFIGDGRWRELVGVHTAEDHAGAWVPGMTRDRPAVLADVEVTVKQAIGREIAGNVEPSATEVGHEHPAPTQPGEYRSRAAGDDVLLMTVDHGRVRQRPPQR